MSTAANLSQLPALTPLMPEPPVVPMEEHAFELFASHLTSLGAVASAALVAVGSVRLVQMWRDRIADDLWARAAKEQLRLRAVELTLRTLHLIAAAEYTATVDALEAHAVTGCEDCWETALDGRAYVLCPGCCARVTADASPVEEDVPVDDPVFEEGEGRPGPVRCADVELAAAREVGL